jgi:hypothetical protein
MDIEALKKEIKRRTRPSNERLLELSRLDPQLSRLIPKHVSNIPLTLYHELIKSRDMPTRAAVAKDPQAPLEILEILARDSQWTVAKAIFGSKVRRKITFPDSLFEIVASHKRHTVRQSVAEHYDCPLHVLERLSRDPAPEVRQAVASNHNTSAEVLDRLSDDPELLVLWNVAKHPNTLDSTLDKLARHPHQFTRVKSIDAYLSDGKIRAIPAERLVSLAHDSDRQVLEYVVSNINTPTEVVEQIFARNPELLETGPEFFIKGNHVYGGGGGVTLTLMLSHRLDLSEDLLRRIADICDGGLHFHVIRHPKINARILDRVAQIHLAYLAQVALEPAKECDPAKQYSSGAERAEYLEYELWSKRKGSSERTLELLLEHPALSPATRSRLEARASD